MLFATKKFPENLYKIDYVEKYPIMSYVDLIQSRNIETIYMKKYSVWEYEKEYRILGETI